MHSTQFPFLPQSLRTFVNYEWSHHLSKHVKSLSHPLPGLFIYRGVHSGTENATARAERWEIAYQIEAIRLNCCHKYYFSHAYAMIAKPRPLQCVLNRDVIFRIFQLFSLLHMHVSVYDVPFSTKSKALTTCGVPSKTAFLHANPPNGIRAVASPQGNNKCKCTRSPEPTKKLNLTESEDFSQQKNTPKQMTSTVFGVDARREVA